ncbi:NAD-dependent epimerase/dehydratase family protein [Neolewinella persica]|uniref:NAD-dependent epimerase/dehydratase family protein n=1 Tax=Neolewinella persica TaxID=70998 RepID=UPI00037619AA|nr:NAD-dependent epimerase/dehydratase family protein [Neolewinella persica]
MQLTNSKKIALLLGATGLVGSALLDELLAHDAYIRVIAPTRRPMHRQHDKLENPVINFDELEEYAGKLPCQDVFIALGTTIKKAGSKEAFRKVDFDYIVKGALVAKTGGANQCLLVSSSGADVESRFFYTSVKGQTEEAIKDLGFWATHIFQPGVLVGNREEFRLGERIGIGVSNLLRRISPEILGDYNPTKVSVLAQKMVDAAQGMEPGVQVHGAMSLLEDKAVSDEDI